MARRILVTGANGLLGRACVARLLARGDSVIAAVRHGAAPTGAQTLQLDLAGDIAPALAGIAPPDCILHLAQEHGWHQFPANSSRITRVAAGATAQLLEYASGSGVVKFVYASSGGVCGPSPAPIREDAPLRPAGEIGFYLAAKAAGEMLAQAFTPAPFTTSILRYFFIYGPGQREEFLLPRLFASVRARTPITLARGVGPRLNPVFVDDAADATLAAMDHPVTAVFNIAGPETRSLVEVVRIIGEVTGVAPVITQTSETPKDIVADVSAIASLYQARTGLEAGLQAMAASGVRQT